MSHPTPERILQTGFGFWASKTLLAAITAGLFTELGKGPLDAPALAERLGWKARSAQEAFDALVSMGMLEKEDGLYRDTEETALFLDRAKPTYMGGILEMADARLYRFWGDLGEALRTDKPQNEAKHETGDHFATLYADPERLKGFLKAMTGISAGTAQALAKLPWEGVTTVMDVGCAEGIVPATLARTHGHLRGIGFDLPPVKPHFEAFAAAQGLRERLSFHGGDLFQEPLPKADAIIMGHMLHWADLDGKRLMLKRAFEALPTGGRLLVYDNILDEGRSQNTFGFLMSLNMLIETPGGREYTGSECEAWMRETGFSKARTQPLMGPASVVIGVK